MKSKRVKEKWKISKWKSLFVVSVILSFSMIYYTLYVDLMSLPSDKWSKEVGVAQVQGDSSNKDYYYEKNFDIVESDEKLEIFATDLTGSMEIYKVDVKGKIEIAQKLENQFSHKIKDMSVVKSDVATLIAYATENEININSYNYSDESYVAGESITIASDYYTVEFNENLVMYNTKEDKNNWFIYDIITRDEYFIENKLFNQVDLVDTGDKIVILTIDNDKDILTFSATEVDKESGEIVVRENDNNIKNDVFDEITKKTKMTLGELKANSVAAIYNEETGKIDVCFVITNSKSKVSQVIASQIDRLTLESNLTAVNSVKVLNPNINMVKSDLDRVKYLSNEQTFIGKKEVSSTKKTSSNVVLYNLDIGGEFETAIKSKTAGYNPSYHHIILGDYEYIVFNEVDDDINSIYISSNNPSIIEISEKFGSEDILKILFGIFTLIMGSIAYSLPYLVITLSPLLFIGIFVNLFCLNWIERNPSKVLCISLFMYSAIKIWYFNVQMGVLRWFSDLGYVPLYITNNTLGMAIVIGILILSGAVMILYKKENSYKSYISHIGMFALTDIIVFTNLFMLFRAL